jgi:hypothetical protein
MAEQALPQWTLVGRAAPAGDPPRGTLGTLRRRDPTGAVPAAAFRRCSERLQWERYIPLGTTGFDVVGSWGWLRVEVPEAS